MDIYRAAKVSGVCHGLRNQNFKFGRSIEVFLLFLLAKKQCLSSELAHVQSRESALLTFSVCSDFSRQRSGR